jgi:hypothetical protein
MQPSPPSREVAARGQASFAADCNTQAFGYSKQNDDATIAALLQSGECTSGRALLRKLGVSNFKLRPALQRVLDSKSAKTIAEYRAATKKQKT